MKRDYNKVKNALGEVQQTLHWVVTFTQSPSVVKCPENVEIRCSTSGLPAPEVTHTQVALGGFTFNFVGKVNKNGSIDLTFVEGTDAAVMNFVHEWLQAYWDAGQGNTTGKQALTKDLYATVKMDLLGPDDEVTQTYELIDCLPSIQPGGELGQDAAAMNPVLSLAFNDYHWTSTTGGQW
jgi:hypothetical protein